MSITRANTGTTLTDTISETDMLLHAVSCPNCRVVVGDLDEDLDAFCVRVAALPEAQYDYSAWLVVYGTPMLLVLEHPFFERGQLDTCAS